ncbi:MAG: nitroreductase family protein [Erysipelotrichaceae bacterium]|nr:nitroreductase family protein [Erysipelotrichaceae bacterium]
MNETLKVMASRYSCRSYENNPITEEELKIILNAGLLAPSAMNSQVDEMFAVINADLIDELALAINVAFKQLEIKKPDNYYCTYHAPILVIVSGPKDYTRLKEDGSCMLENMFLAAESLNIGSCWINQLRDTQDLENVRAVLSKIGIPENHQVVGCAALGYSKKRVEPKNKKENRIHIIK